MSAPSRDIVRDLIARGWALLREPAIEPRATYRVQLHRHHLTFRSVQGALPYLEALGISHLYTSPHLRCRAGSDHGYDVVDHDEINGELGTEEELATLHRMLAERRMGVLLDWVPNHMGLGPTNQLWIDVLESGPGSRYARFFDIDWQPVRTALTNKVLVPVLGDQYGVILERGEIKLGYDRGAFSIAYWERCFPVSPTGASLILEHQLDRLTATVPATDPDLQELHSILSAIHNLPPTTASDQGRLAERRREQEVIKRRLAGLCERSAPVREHVELNVQAFNGTTGARESFELLHHLLELQGYRLAHWRVAAEEINYRRFFDVNELAAIRMEDPVVFQHTHRLLSRWIARGWVRALRIDHPDGLFFPRDYFLRLQAQALFACCQRALAETRASSAPGNATPDAGEPGGRARGGPEERSEGPPAPSPGAPTPATQPGQPGQPESSAATTPEELERALWDECVEEVRRAVPGAGLPLHVVVEKILGEGEELPESWLVSGTTGYDFLNSVNGLFVDGSAARSLSRIYKRFVGHQVDLAELVYRSKKLILQASLAAELQQLAHQLQRISDSDPRTRDFTLASLTDALTEVIACFPVYRTYIPQGQDKIDARDVVYVESALEGARRRMPFASRSVFDFIRDVLLKAHPPYLTQREIDDRLAFVGKFQQTTPPAMAKGTEDTAFYIANRLVSVNEVGGEPEHLGTSVNEFHGQNIARLARRSGSLLTTSTHDTKRGEDVRLRIDALSEVSQEWQRHLADWARWNRPLRGSARRGAAPDRNDEYLFYQTLLGVWPGGTPDGEALERLTVRLEAYMLKAAREAKVHTSWINQSQEYEQGLVGFVRGLLHRPYTHRFWQSFLSFQQKLAWAGTQSSLSQVVLRHASPGIPDLYQGAELWDLNLVDPDNRAPVDFEKRARLLEDMSRRAARPDGLLELARSLSASPGDGAIKMYVIWRCLRLRQRLPELFAKGDYVPLEATGERASHVVSLARTRAGVAVIAVVGRLFLRLAAHAGGQLPGGLATGPALWGDTEVELPRSSCRDPLRDALTGRTFSLPDPGEGRSTLAMAELFSVLPVALLEWAPM